MIELLMWIGLVGTGVFAVGYVHDVRREVSSNVNLWLCTAFAVWAMFWGTRG